MLRNTLFTITLLVFALPANATLIGRLPKTIGGTDFQAYYDTSASLTWLADANHTDSSGYDDVLYGRNTYGKLTWSDSLDWAASLSINGVNGWRLPNSDDCANYNCTGSEMGSFFYNILGGTTAVNIMDSHDSNYDLFSNIGQDMYWSSVGFYDSRFRADYAYSFWFKWGYQSSRAQQQRNNVWAVYDGDVIAVPESGSLQLVILGLIGLALRKKFGL